MSEIPFFGRNAPYIVSFALFVILAVPTALVNNYPGLLVLRFLTGFMGSPCLATGGATMQDMVSRQHPRVEAKSDEATVLATQTAVFPGNLDGSRFLCARVRARTLGICRHG